MLGLGFFSDCDPEPEGAPLWVRYTKAVDDKRTILEGPLYKISKQNPGVAVAGEFILQPDYLLYKSSLDQHNVSSAIKISTAHVEFIELTNSELPWAIRISRKGRCTTLYCQKADQYIKWQQQLSRIALRADFAARFVLQELIGHGSFANVYRAVEAQPSSPPAAGSQLKEFAIKTFSKDAVLSERFGKKVLWNEIQILRKVSHPNVSRLLEVQETADCIYLVFEMCKGGTLYQKVRLGCGLDEQEIHNVILGVSSGLKYLQDCHVVHRDLNPNNILLRKNTNITPEDVVIADFGLAVDTLSYGYFVGRCGTAGYIAPELLDWSRDYETKRDFFHSIDLYSLGAVLYFMVCRESPFSELGVGSADTFQFAGIESRVACLKGKFSQHSRKLKELFASLIDLDPLKRPQAESIVNYLPPQKSAAASPAAAQEKNFESQSGSWSDSILRPSAHGSTSDMQDSQLDMGFEYGPSSNDILKITQKSENMTVKMPSLQQKYFALDCSSTKTQTACEEVPNISTSGMPMEWIDVRNSTKIGDHLSIQQPRPSLLKKSKMALPPFSFGHRNLTSPAPQP